MENYAKLQIQTSSYKTYQGFINNHIKPASVEILLAKLTAMELQRLYKHLLENGRVECRESRNKPKASQRQDGTEHQPDGFLRPELCDRAKVDFQ